MVCQLGVLSAGIRREAQGLTLVNTGERCQKYRLSAMHSVGRTPERGRRGDTDAAVRLDDPSWRWLTESLDGQAIRDDHRRRYHRVVARGTVTRPTATRKAAAMTPGTGDAVGLYGGARVRMCQLQS